MTTAAGPVPFPLTFVSLDLETTGLNADSDRIIEVGAVKVVGGEFVDSFQRLINPGHTLPDFVSVLTGITDADLVGAPPFGVVAEELAAFIGDLPMVGQNYRFDLGFPERGRGESDRSGVRHAGSVTYLCDLRRRITGLGGSSRSWTSVTTVRTGRSRTLRRRRTFSRSFGTGSTVSIPVTIAMIRSLVDRAAGRVERGGGV